MFVDDIRDWIQEVVDPTETSVLVIIAPTNAPAPAGDYLTVFDMGAQASCYPSVEREWVDPETKEMIKHTTQIHSVVTMSVNAYASNGEELLSKIKAAASLPPEQGRPVMADCSDIRNLAFLDDTGFTPRYQCDYTFRVSYLFTAEDYPARTVQITGELSDMESDITVELEP